MLYSEFILLLKDNFEVDCIVNNSFNYGYLFLQQIYYEIGLHNDKSLKPINLNGLQASCFL